MKTSFTSFFGAMGFAVALSVIFAGLAPAKAQPQRPDMAVQKAEMQKLRFIAGKWEGTGWVMRGPERFEFRQTEDVRFHMDGALLLIDGRGFPPQAPEGTPPVFAAFAVISYNDAEKSYEFRSYANGYANTFGAEILEDGALQWQAGPVRYRIWVNEEGEWFEIGDRKTGEGEWVQFFEMTLRRTD